jgi:hypothetical protein
VSHADQCGSCNQKGRQRGHMQKVKYD